MKKTGYLAMVAMASSAFLMAGCGGSDSNEDNSSVTGTWGGTIVSTIGNYDTALVLAQDGVAVSGTWDGSYSVSGTLTDANLKLSGTTVESGVTYTYSMDLIKSGETMTGTVSLAGTRGSSTSTVTGTMSVTRSSKALLGPEANEVAHSLMNAIMTGLKQ